MRALPVRSLLPLMLCAAALVLPGCERGFTRPPTATEIRLGLARRPTTRALRPRPRSRWDGIHAPSDGEQATGSFPMLPRASSEREVPLSVSACADPRFPRRLGDGHVGCSQRGQRLDRFLSSDGVLRPLASPDGPLWIDPASAAVSSGEDALLVWAAKDRGRWSPGLSERRTTAPSERPALPQHPAGDQRGLVFAGDGRLVLADWGAQHQLHMDLRPAATPGSIALSSKHIAVLEGEAGALVLWVLPRGGGTPKRVDEGDLRSPIFVGDALGWASGTRIFLLDLEDGELRSWSLASVGPLSPFADRYLLAAERLADGGRLWAFQQGSATGQAFWRSSQPLELRGAYGLALTVARRPPGGEAVLLTRAGSGWSGP